MKTLRKIVEIDDELCDGCGQCVISCAEGAMEIVDGKAKVVKDTYCDGLGACIGECPQGALRIIEREADEFDPEAVEHHLRAKEKGQASAGAAESHGCPSARLQMFDTACEQANRPVSRGDGDSALSHWPVQIRLVPAKAPFLQGAHLLIAADCTPVACASFHRDFLPGKVVLMGCPKFDDKNEYVRKFTEIFQTANIQSITVLDMEVPCCSALPMIVKKALEAAGKTIPLEEVVISTRGQVLGRRDSAA